MPDLAPLADAVSIHDERGGRQLKITNVAAVYPKWSRLPSGVWQSHFWQIVVRVETDVGTVGRWDMAMAAAGSPPA